VAQRAQGQNYHVYRGRSELAAELSQLQSAWTSLPANWDHVALPLVTPLILAPCPEDLTIALLGCGYITFAVVRGSLSILFADGTYPRIAGLHIPWPAGNAAHLYDGNETRTRLITFSHRRRSLDTVLAFGPGTIEEFRVLLELSSNPNFDKAPTLVSV
jgi:hypothetical protein